MSRSENAAVPVSRLVRRITLGATASEMALARQLGWQGYLEHHLNYKRIDDSACENTATGRWPLANRPIHGLLSVNLVQAQNDIRQATIFRAVYSKRQLHQRMVEFWTDHFSQDIDRVQQLLIPDQRDVIRQHALGKFPAMVRASSKSASMIAYLDQAVSSAGSPNQNYARELLELHTVGVDGGYSQTDVEELARVLTGWSVGLGQFLFIPTIHDWGAKRVMGLDVPASSSSLGQAGVQEGERVIDMLVAHPSTARFIATKMLRWLLDPNPSESQIETVAAVYRATGGDIQSMIRVILNETWVGAAPMKLKRPYHFLVSAMRSVNLGDAGFSFPATQLQSLGQQLFDWDTPDGYPDSTEYWSGNVLPKWNFAATLSSILPINTDPYLGGSPAAAVDVIDQNFFSGEMPPTTRNGLLKFIGTSRIDDAKVRELMALAISSNAFQWY